MSTWGSELWDRYSSVVSHVTRGAEELTSVYAKFIKERGDLEREYAKSIRKLLVKYQQKTENKQSKESSQAKGFRLVLQEMGFQAGQHEILSEIFTTKLHQEVQKKAKEISKLTKNNMKDANKMSEDLNKMYKDLDKAKHKYKRSFLDWEDSKTNYTKADTDGTLSRNEIAKLKSLFDSRSAQCDDYKGAYASQLMKTNACQAEYYNKELPGVLNSLQNIEIGRIDYFKHVMDQCVAAEEQVSPIVDKCREDTKNIIKTIEPVADSHLLINQLKTGEVPPKDLSFEEITCGTEVKFGTLGRKKSKLKLNKQAQEEKLFPRIKELESEISNVESEISKGKKEIAALQLMVQSYTNNPKFGNAKKFQSELDSAIYQVQVQESDLHALNTQMKNLNYKMEEKTGESPRPSFNTPLTIQRIDHSPGGNRSNSIQSSSAGYGTISNCSSSDSFENSDIKLMVLGDSFETVMALYAYNSDNVESSIAMETGEEFFVIEGDEGGWTKVRRKNSVTDDCEGYVPTAYLRYRL